MTTLNLLGILPTLKALNYKVTIKCKTEAQKKFLNMLKDKKKELCFGVGAPRNTENHIYLWHSP